MPIAFLILFCQRRWWVEEKENQDLPGGETFYNRVAESSYSLENCIIKSNFKIDPFYANAWHATNVLWIYFSNVSEPLRALFDVWWKPLAHQKLGFNVLHKLLVFGQIYYQRWKCHSPNSGNTTKITPMLLREAPIKSAQLAFDLSPPHHTHAVPKN